MTDRINAIGTIGIDIGVNGAIVRCSVRVDFNQSLEKSKSLTNNFDLSDVTVWTMPVKIAMGEKGRKKVLDVAGLAKLLHYALHDVNVIAVERVHAFPNQGVVSMFNFGFQYGAVMGMLEAFALRGEKIATVLSFDAREWRAFFFGVQKGQSKKERKRASIALVSQSFAIELDGFRKQFRDGIADALLIALYGAYRYAQEQMFYYALKQ